MELGGLWWQLIELLLVLSISILGIQKGNGLFLLNVFEAILTAMACFSLPTMSQLRPLLLLYLIRLATACLSVRAVVTWLVERITMVCLLLHPLNFGLEDGQIYEIVFSMASINLNYLFDWRVALNLAVSLNLSMTCYVQNIFFSFRNYCIDSTLDQICDNHIFVISTIIDIYWDFEG